MTGRKPSPTYEALPGEVWAPCPGFEERYEVSDQGRVRSLPHVHYGGRLITVYRRPGKYAVVHLFRDGRGRQRDLHRLVAIAFLGQPLPEQECRHLNGDCWDPRLANLAWGTKSENARDQLRHGTQANARKTHCKHGHEFTPENIYRAPSAPPHVRKCRVCNLARSHRAKSREQVAA